MTVSWRAVCITSTILSAATVVSLIKRTRKRYQVIRTFTATAACAKDIFELFKDPEEQLLLGAESEDNYSVDVHTLYSPSKEEIGTVCFTFTCHPFSWLSLSTEVHRSWREASTEAPYYVEDFFSCLNCSVAVWYEIVGELSSTDAPVVVTAGAEALGPILPAWLLLAVCRSAIEERLQKLVQHFTAANTLPSLS